MKSDAQKLVGFLGMPNKCAAAAAVGASLLAAIAQAGDQREGASLCRIDALRCCSFPTPSRIAAARRAAPGFGVQVWPSALTKESGALEHLITLNPGHLRFSFGPNWNGQPELRAEMSDDELDAAIANGYASVGRLKDHLAAMQDVRRRTNARNHLVVWEPPPLPGEIDSAAAKAQGLRVLDHGAIDLLARFHVANLKYLAGIGLPVDAIELSNEPDGNWNIRMAPADYLALVQAVRREAKRRGLILPRIHGPGTSTVASTLRFLADPDVARGIAGAVDTLSLHVWDDKAGQDRFVELDRLFKHLDALGLKPEIAVTEYGLAKPDIEAEGAAMNAGNRVRGSVTNAPGYPAASLATLAMLYDRRIGTVLYWEFQDQSWGSGLYGLVDTEGRPKPIFEDYRKLTSLIAAIHPASVEAAHEGRVALLRGSAGSHAVLTNPAASPMDVVIASEGGAPAGPERCDAGPRALGIRVPPGGVVSLPLADR